MTPIFPPMHHRDKTVIVIGALYPEDMKKRLMEEGAVLDMAADTFERSIITGLYKQGVKYTIITSPLIRWRNKKFSFIKGCEFKCLDYNETHDYCVSKLNIPVIGRIFDCFAVRKQLRQTLKKNSTASVIINSLYTPFLLAYFTLWGVSRKSCVVVEDLPQYMSGNRSIFYRFAKAIDRIVVNFCLTKIDSYVLLSRHMIGTLPRKNKCVVVEGIYNTTIGLPPKKTKRGEISILYTGGISRRYGVFDLIEAFTRIPDNNYRLYLCGNCDEMALMNKYLEQDDRILYLGLVKKEKVCELQRNATLLVNPRHSNKTFTKYSFPSKTMEYLASGTPTVMCNLQCLPEEYKEYIFLFDDESIEGYSRKIMDICSRDAESLLEFGKRASRFIMTQKNEVVQTKKILDLLYENE